MPGPTRARWPNQLERVLHALDGQARVLEIVGTRRFRHESVYLDTPELDSYLRTARRRPNRFKVRTRTYVDSGRCLLEVKLRNRRDQTVKHRLPDAFEDRCRLTTDGVDYVRTFAEVAAIADRLEPAITTRYRRSTIVIGSNRATIDDDVQFCNTSGSGGFDGHVIVETKSACDASEIDRALWAEHIRPLAVSKYGVGMAALDPSLPANKWTRILRNHTHPRRPTR